MALDALRCNHLAPLGFKGLIIGRRLRRYVIGHYRRCVADDRHALKPTYTVFEILTLGCQKIKTSTCDGRTDGRTDTR